MVAFAEAFRVWRPGYISFLGLSAIFSQPIQYHGRVVDVKTSYTHDGHAYRRMEAGKWEEARIHVVLLSGFGCHLVYVAVLGCQAQDHGLY